MKGQVSQDTVEMYKAMPLEQLKDFIAHGFFNKQGKALIRKVIKEKERNDSIY